MTRRQWFLVIAIVILVHGVLFVIFGPMRALPKARYVPPPNFRYHEEYYIDPKTNEKTSYVEYQISTKLSPHPPAAKANVE